MNDEKGKEVMIQDQGEWGKKQWYVLDGIEAQPAQERPREKSAREIGRKKVM